MKISDFITHHYRHFNAAALVVTLVCNGLANALPLNGMDTGELSALYPNLFVTGHAESSRGGHGREYLQRMMGRVAAKAIAG